MPKRAGTRLLFVGIIASWLGWSAPTLAEAEAEAEALKLWDIVEIGLRGHAIGRSAEKILPTVAKSLGKAG